MALSDTNQVDLYFSEEGSWGETPSSPAMTQVRYTGESLSYNKQSRTSEQIRSDMMRDQVALVGFDTNGGFNYELAAGSFNSFLEGVMSNAFTAISLSSLTLTVAATAKTVTRSAGSFVTDGIVAGMWVRFGGFTNAGNNIVARIASLTATVLTLDTGTTGLVDETGDGNETVVANLLRNGTTAKSYLLEKRFTDISRFISYTGMRVSSFNMAVTQQEIITGSFEFMGKTAVSAGATVSGSDTDAATTPVITASANVGTITKDGAAIGTPLKSLSLDVSRNLRAQSQIGSTEAAGIGYGFFDVTGSIEAYFQDSALYDDLLNHSSLSLSFKVTDDDGNVMVFTLPKVYFTEGSPNASGGNDDVVLPLNYTAVRDATTDCMLQIDYLPVA